MAGMTQGLKPNILRPISARLKRLRKNSERQAKIVKSIPQGLKPAFILLAFCGMAEAMP